MAEPASAGSVTVTAVTLLVAVSFDVGCSPRRPATVPVRGVVTLDGSPLGGATVLFQPVAGTPGRAVTADDGSFELTTFDPGDGALLGRHRVAVMKVTLSGLNDVGGVTGPVAAGEVREKWVTPKKYATPGESGLEVDVGQGMSAVVLELESR